MLLATWDSLACSFQVWFVRLLPLINLSFTSLIRIMIPLRIALAALLCLLYPADRHRVEARNIVATPDGVAVATTDQGGRRRDLVTYGESTQQVHQFPDLPGAVRGFDDVAVDQDSARDGRAIVFAIDADSALVCSFRLSFDGGVSMRLIGCSTQRVSVNPYVGIAAKGGTVVVSGGTSGVSIFRYNTSTGRLDDRPTIRNRDLGQVGHPGVTMISRDMAALCTDFRRSNRSGSSEFGVTIATINTGTRSVRDARFFRVPDTVGFDYAIQPGERSL